MKVLIILSSVIHLALCFCGNHKLHGKLAESVVQVSNSLRKKYSDNVTRLEPHVTSAMISALRLVGFLPHTIKSDFKYNESYTVEDYLKAYLDSHHTHHETISNIRHGRLANIFRGVTALCKDPENFHGHNITKALVKAFETLQNSTRKDCFEYSSVALAVCQTGTIGPGLASAIVNELSGKAFRKNGQTNSKRLDGRAMAVMALSCARQTIPEAEGELLGNVNATISRYLERIVDALKKPQGKTWNAQTKGLVVQALMSVPKALRPKHWHCNWLLSAILAAHDPERGFSNVLADIQILPALLGKSLMQLDTSCYKQNRPDENNKNITVCIKLLFQDDQRSAPSNLTLRVPNKTTAYEILVRAAERNDTYKFQALETSYGRMITSISNIAQNQDTGYYWALYANETLLAPDGVDIFTPQDNSCIIFKYEKYHYCTDEDAKDEDGILNK